MTRSDDNFERSPDTAFVKKDKATAGPTERKII